MILWNAVQGSAGSTLPFTPSSVSTHASNERLTLYVVGRDPVSSTPDTPTATNGWTLVKSYLDVTTGLCLYAFAIEATSSSMAAPQIAFPGSTPTATAWVMTTHRKNSGRFWKDPIGTAGNDGTTYGDWIFPNISSGTQYSYDNYPLPNNWFGGGLTAALGVLAVPTDSASQMDIFQTGMVIYNTSGGQTSSVATQYAETSAGGGLAVAWISKQNFSGNPVENINAYIQLDPSTSEDGLIISVLMREDTVAPPAPPTTGTASLSLTAAGAIPTAVGSASLALSATGVAADGDPGWITLDLSLTEFLYNPATPGTPFGQYSGGKIQPITFGSGLTVYFQHPDFQLEDLNSLKGYEIEVTYDPATTYTRGEFTANPLKGATSWWNDADYDLGLMGAFDATGLPAIRGEVGYGAPFSYGSFFTQAKNSGYQGLTFGFTNRTIITQIRYREILSRPGSASASLSLSAAAFYDAPPPAPVSSPIVVDMTPASVTGAGSKVGSGNVLNDGSDGTYFELNGQTYFPEVQGSLNAGWLTVPIPALPNITSINAISLNMRAEFYGIAGTPTLASMWVAIEDEASPSPRTYSSAYAYLLPLKFGSPNFPEIPLGSIQDLSYTKTDWQGASLGYPTGLNDPLAAATLTALRTGTAQLLISPRYYFGNSSPTHRIQGKFYEVSLTIDFDVGTPSVEEPPPGLPSGYTDWQELDLSTAIFYHSGAPNTSTVPATPTGYAYGRYDAAAERILTNTPSGGWPDFSIPGFEMDPAKDYYFEFVFDSLDVRDGGSNYRDVYLWMANPDDPHRSYYEETYGSKVLYQSDNDDGTNFHVFHLDPVAAYNNGENWDVLANGFTLPIFETRQGSVLAAIRYATRDDGYLPPEGYSPPESARAHFWGH